MGEVPTYDSLPNFPTYGDHKIVAPFADDINTYSTGTVKYTDFSVFDTYSTAMNNVSSFIQSQFPDNQYFSGTRMMVTEWLNVPEYSIYVSFYRYVK